MWGKVCAGTKAGSVKWHVCLLYGRREGEEGEMEDEGWRQAGKCVVCEKLLHAEMEGNKAMRRGGWPVASAFSHCRVQRHR